MKTVKRTSERITRRSNVLKVSPVVAKTQNAQVKGNKDSNKRE